MTDSKYSSRSNNQYTFAKQRASGQNEVSSGAYPGKNPLCLNCHLNDFCSTKEQLIEPSIPIKWVKGLKVAYSLLGATQRDQYSWVAKTDDAYVFSAEIDHIHPEDNIYNHKSGVFTKCIPPMSKSTGHDPLSVSHSKELFDAVSDSYANNLKCRMLLVKGTKFGTTQGGIKAAADGHLWNVTELKGSVENGYSFKVERVE